MSTLVTHDLVQALSHVTTLSGMLRVTATTLKKHFRFNSFTLSQLHSGISDSLTYVFTEHGGEQAQQRLSLAGTILENILQQSEIWLSALPPHTRPSQKEPLPDEYPPGTAQETLWCVIPLFAQQEAIGYAYFPMPSLEPSEQIEYLTQVEEVQGILALVMRYIVLLERVAQISQKAHRENKRLRNELESYEHTNVLQTQSAVMRKVLEAIELVARHSTTVLLRGETGTGKEFLARRLHKLSPRRHKPFIQINCGAIPEHLIESELFGHEKGSFTGAYHKHIGRFERADGGSILLDEVGELPLAAQTRLLRVLQEKELERVGGERVIPVDVRVIAATHRPLEEMVQEGTFRADLYYRLQVFPIVVPPLRERREDIPWLAYVLVQRITKKLGGPPKNIPQYIQKALLDYHWPGNVRELENVLERAVILSKGDVLEWSTELLANPLESYKKESQIVFKDVVDKVETFEEASKRCIVQALQKSNGRIYGPSGAAQMLALKPSTLQSKMKKLGIVFKKKTAGHSPAYNN